MVSHRSGNTGLGGRYHTQGHAIRTMEWHPGRIERLRAWGSIHMVVEQEWCHARTRAERTKWDHMNCKQTHSPASQCSQRTWAPRNSGRSRLLPAYRSGSDRHLGRGSQLSAHKLLRRGQGAQWRVRLVRQGTCSGHRLEHRHLHRRCHGSGLRTLRTRTPCSTAIRYNRHK